MIRDREIDKERESAATEAANSSARSAGPSSIPFGTHIKTFAISVASLDGIFVFYSLSSSSSLGLCFYFFFLKAGTYDTQTKQTEGDTRVQKGGPQRKKGCEKEGEFRTGRNTTTANTPH